MKLRRLRARKFSTKSQIFENKDNKELIFVVTCNDDREGVQRVHFAVVCSFVPFAKALDVLPKQPLLLTDFKS